MRASRRCVVAGKQEHQGMTGHPGLALRLGRRSLWLAGCLLLTTAAGAGERTDGRGETPVDVNRDVRPILSNVCYTCHGPDEGKRQAGLRLDLKEGALGEVESGGHAVVPVNSAASVMVQRLTHEDPGLRMP